MPISLVELQKLRLALGKAVQDFTKEGLATEKAAAREDPSIGKAIKPILQAVKVSYKKVTDALDNALNEKDEKKRASLYATADKAASELLKLMNDAKVQAVAANPFSPIRARAAVSKVLSELTRKL